MHDPVTNLMMQIALEPELSHIDRDKLMQLLISTEDSILRDILDELDGKHTEYFPVTEIDDYVRATGYHFFRPEQKYREVLAMTLRALLLKKQAA